VSGITTAEGVQHEADVVVSNMEVIPAHETLLPPDNAARRRLRRFAPACSGLILDLGLDISYPQLAHHNFFYSGEQRGHFDAVFKKGILSDDPTIYLVAASKTDPTVAPPGCDCLKILPHIPCLNEHHPLTDADYMAFKDRVIIKLERMGLTDLRKHIVFEHVWTPRDIQRQYFSNRGSIYGVVADKWKNFGFKAPKQDARYANLFFVGGSVNPGGGMPMVVLCGQNVCRKIVEWDRR
jgi:diapolycopene oxygenase